MWQLLEHNKAAGTGTGADTATQTANHFGKKALVQQDVDTWQRGTEGRLHRRATTWIPGGHQVSTCSHHTVLMHGCRRLAARVGHVVVCDNLQQHQQAYKGEGSVRGVPLLS
jgi:hypothetical protein